MSAQRQIGVGVIGCGRVSQAYFRGAQLFEVFHIVACADVEMEAARAQAELNGCEALSVDALLSRSDIEIVLNLTVPAAHAGVSRRILEAGKHVYCEKPLTVDLKDAQALLGLARSKGLRVGCAPDTFLGAGIQTVRDILDSGSIGRITSGTAFMLNHGHESWHPNPGFYYLRGGGPVFDMAPYYLTALVYLVGPVRRVSAITTKAYGQRVATCKERRGEILPVEVNTHASGILEFHNGAVMTAVFSFDVHAAGHSPIELYGTGGSIKVPDPNTFGGPVERILAGEKQRGWQTIELTRPYSENSRGIGVADLAQAILDGRPHLACGSLASHVLEVMHAFDKSSESGRAIRIESKPERPPFGGGSSAGIIS
ncbi:MAG: Gfo/Idh/MocA family protein [Opitutales bacterium]